MDWILAGLTLAAWAGLMAAGMPWVGFGLLVGVALGRMTYNAVRRSVGGR